MMRYLFAILAVCLFIIIHTDNVFALRINEIESNPEGDDSGNEWVEIYSDEAINLEEYYIENGDGGIYNLSGNFNGFLVIVFPNQWLDNKDEIVYLKHNNNLIDSSGNFTDNKKEKTYSYCSGEWKFATESKNNDNLCDGSVNTQTNNQNTNNNENSNINQNTQNNNQNNNQNVNNNEETEQEKDNNELDLEINKNSPSINQLVNSESTQNTKKILLKNTEKETKSEITKTYKTRVTVIYFFIGLCVLIVVLIALRKL